MEPPRNVDASVAPGVRVRMLAARRWRGADKWEFPRPFRWFLWRVRIVSNRPIRIVYAIVTAIARARTVCTYRYREDLKNRYYRKGGLILRLKSWVLSLILRLRFILSLILRPKFYTL